MRISVMDEKPGAQYPLVEIIEVESANFSGLEGELFEIIQERLNDGYVVKIEKT